MIRVHFEVYNPQNEIVGRGSRDYKCDYHDFRVEMFFEECKFPGVKIIDIETYE